MTRRAMACLSSAFTAGLLLLSNANPASAQDTAEAAHVPASLLDIPGGPKQQLRDAGIGLSVNYTEFYKGLVEGEGNHGWEFGGKTDVIANFDGGRLGLWPGLFVNVHAEFINGDNVLEQGDGSILPTNTALALPTLGGNDEDLSIVVTQAFSESTTLSVGKFNMLDAASKTPLLGGGGLTTFMNIALAAPVCGVTPPYIVGGILSHKTEPASYTLMVYDPRNAQSVLGRGDDQPVGHGAGEPRRIARLPVCAWRLHHRKRYEF